MTDEDLIHSFESCTLDPAAFHHRDHIHLAWSYLNRFPFATALSRFCDGLRRFAIHIGRPGVYHETITCAFIMLINERMAGEDWESFSTSNPDLFSWNPSILDRYYAPETLASERARRVFVLPDRGLTAAAQSPAA